MEKEELAVKELDKLIMDGRIEKNCVVSILKEICIKYKLVKEN